MGLVIRIRHALGERMLELFERAEDSPVIVGRAPAADVRIPSLYVGTRHVALFVHEGQWMVQNAAQGTGSLLNGEPLAGAKALSAGDVLALGPEAGPPTIEIDSLDVVAIAPQVPPAAPEPVVEQRHVPSPLGPIYVRQTPIAEPVEAEPEPDWIDTVQPATYARPRRRRTWDGLIALSMLLTIAVVGGAVIYTFVHRQTASPTSLPVALVTAPEPATQAAEPPIPKPAIHTIFTEQPVPDPEPEAAPEVETKPPLPDLTDDEPAPLPTQTKPATRRTVLFLDPEAEEKFKAVEGAYYNPDPAKALVAFDSYTDKYPSSHQTEIEQYRGDMLDKIWWERVDSLFAKRKELSAAIRKTEKDIKDETEATYKKTVLQPRLDDQKKRLAIATDRLVKDMAYTSPNPPPIGKGAEMKDLRIKRDPKVYDAWCKRVLKYIRDTRGSYPWANEK